MSAETKQNFRKIKLILTIELYYDYNPLTERDYV